MSSVPTIALNNGVQIPQLGFGVFQIKPEETAKATAAALEIGYRHIDTAQMYGNEREVGQAVRESGIDRGEIFVTSKLNNNRLEHDDILKAFDASLEALGFEYLDLFLIHWPLPAVADVVARWKAMEEIYATGKVRAIGVSNHHTNHLNAIFDQTEIKPAVNQIEVQPVPHPGGAARVRRRARDRDRGLVADRPGQGDRGPGRSPGSASSTASRRPRSRSAGTSSAATSSSRSRSPAAGSRTTSRIFDFELDEGQMAAISALDRGERTGPNPDEMNYVPS